jgi:hypothetical protein
MQNSGAYQLGVADARPDELPLLHFVRDPDADAPESLNN